MYKRILVAVVFAAASTASYADDQWVTLGETERHLYRAKLDTFELSENKGGEAIVVAVGQVEDRNNSTVEVQRWYVTTSDCERGIGDLVILEANGTYITSVDFVLQGASIASGKADGLCYFHALRKARQESKGM